MTRTTDERIVEQLDQMLKVLALQVAADKTLTERVNLLKLAGLDNRTIAGVFDLEESTVRTLISRSRKQKTVRKSVKGA